MARLDSLKEQLINKLSTDTEKIEVIAFLLNELTPTRENLLPLIDLLEDGVKCELYSRLANHYDNDDDELIKFNELIEDADIDEDTDLTEDDFLN